MLLPGHMQKHLGSVCAEPRSWVAQTCWKFPMGPTRLWCVTGNIAVASPGRSFFYFMQSITCRAAVTNDMATYRLPGRAPLGPAPDSAPWPHPPASKKAALSSSDNYHPHDILGHFGCVHPWTWVPGMQHFVHILAGKQWPCTRDTYVWRHV